LSPWHDRRWAMTTKRGAGSTIPIPCWEQLGTIDVGATDLCAQRVERILHNIEKDLPV
jgi:hypothetical protein